MTPFDVFHPEAGRSPLEPLPIEMADDLREIDSRCGELTKLDRAAMPAGLADRTFVASASLLPHATPVREAPLRLVGTGIDRDTEQPEAMRLRLPRHRQNWARIAIAASVVIACGAGLWFAQQPQPHRSAPTPVQPTMTASGSNESPATMFASSARFDRLPVSDVARWEEEIAHLHETNDISSGDLKLELAMVVRDLEG